MNRFLVTGTMLMMPGFNPIARPPTNGVDNTGVMPSMGTESASIPSRPTDGVTPAVPVIVTPLEVPMSIPQPI